MTNAARKKCRCAKLPISMIMLNNNASHFTPHAGGKELFDSKSWPRGLTLSTTNCSCFFFTHPYHSIFRWLPYNSNKTMYNMKLSITYCKLCWLSRDKQGEYKSVTSGTASVVSEHWEGWNIVPPLCFSFMPCYLRYILERCWKFVLTDTWGWNWNWSCDCGMAVLVLEFQLRHFGEWQVEMCVDFIQWRDFWIW